MTKKQSIQIFEERKVRTVWDDEKEEWYFSVVDVVAVLTDSVDQEIIGRYSKTDLRRREKKRLQIVTV